MTMTTDVTTDGTSMAGELFAQHRVIDVDTHLTEPPDVWTARMPKAMHDQVPHIERIDGKDTWMVSGERLGAPGYYSMAGWDGVMPTSVPGTYDEIDPSMYDSAARLQFLDEQGIQAQVLYPNVGGFGNGYFLRLGDRELVAGCVRAYNDFLTDWCSADPQRLIAVTALPFWDREMAIEELHRCIERGHRAVNFCNQPQDYGQPHLADTHWDPIWAAAQEAGLSVSFHVGGGSMGTQFVDHAGMGWMTNFAKVSSFIFMDNMRCIGDLIFGGVCHRFPNLKLVSVESGVGWIPAALETFDWQWRNGGVRDEHPEYDLLPSEYFRRQIFGCFWFEQQAALDAISRYPDNILFESDYPHPTCQHPGPRSAGQPPRDYATELLGGFSDDVVRKVLHDNAAAIYGLS
ncbi:MAG: hydrolase [Ilumatobacteraceae bacterium]|nr:hydrolase [Ilumatobacteraceae bacterium]